MVIRVSRTVADANVAPIAWPIAKLLDYVLGKSETHTYKKAELKCISFTLAGAPSSKLAYIPSGLSYNSIAKAKNLFVTMKSAF